jgi:4-amino-4-deoxy-L-arabinose transferase-like glycosyltransferase
MTTTSIRTRPAFDWYHVAALALALVSFALAAFISRAVFDRLPHLEDEVAYLFQAQVYARGDLTIDVPTPKQPFWRPFVVDSHPSGEWFSKYTPGWSAWLALGVILQAPWLINASFAMLTVVLTYRLGREIFNPDVGLIAAALLTFSPIALLLSGTLMGHTSALFFVALFLYAYWRLSRPRPLNRQILWGLVAGFALGMLVINRSFTGIAISAPLILWSVIRLGLRLVKSPQAAWRTLMPLIGLSVVTVIIALAIPIYNNAATGDPTQNLYVLVWDYDQPGFGVGHGRNQEEGHTIRKGVQFARYDLSLLAADLFGWQTQPVTPLMQQYLTGRPPQGITGDAYWLGFGWSWLLIIPGIIVGYRGKWWAWLWAVNVAVWIAWLPSAFNNSLTLWLIFGGVLALAPLIFVASLQADDGDPQPAWTWLLLSIGVALITAHLAYWIGSQRYSTRYYFEMIIGVCILSALPLAWIIRKIPALKLVVYIALAAVCLWSIVSYSTPRIDALRDFNRIDQTLLREVNARRQNPDQPALVIVNGTGVSWRSYGALMTSTSPFLDSDIVAAYDNQTAGMRDRILEMFPGREIIEMGATDAPGGDHSWFFDTCPEGVDRLEVGACPIANPPRVFDTGVTTAAVTP